MQSLFEVKSSQTFENWYHMDGSSAGGGGGGVRTSLIDKHKAIGPHRYER